VAIINLAFARSLAPALLAGAAAMWLVSLWLIRSAPDNRKENGADIKLKNPFELLEVFRFGLMLTAVMLLAVAARHLFGDAGLIALAAISGLADVDAITLSMAKTSTMGATAGPALAILAAAGVNTLAKAVYAAYIGGTRIGLMVAMGTFLGFAAAAAAWLMITTAAE
jgi:uncharacterized membrane protein (DUF4010 family)